MRKVQIGVIGPSKVNYPKDEKMARDLDNFTERIGELIAKSGAVLFVGGGSGIMESCARGAKKFGGLTVGTPGRNRLSSNEFIDIEVLTPIDIGDFIFAGMLSCDAIIVVGESAGTTAELTLAYRSKKKMIIVEGFSEYYDSFIDGFFDAKEVVKFEGAKGAEEAVKIAMNLAEKNLLKSAELSKSREPI